MRFRYFPAVLALFLCFVLSACDSGGASDDLTVSDLTGTWVFVEPIQIDLSDGTPGTPPAGFYEGSLVRITTSDFDVLTSGTTQEGERCWGNRYEFELEDRGDQRIGVARGGWVHNMDYEMNDSGQIVLGNFFRLESSSVDFEQVERCP